MNGLRCLQCPLYEEARLLPCNSALPPAGFAKSVASEVAPFPTRTVAHELVTFGSICIARQQGGSVSFAVDDVDHRLHFGMVAIVLSVSLCLFVAGIGIHQ